MSRRSRGLGILGTIVLLGGAEAVRASPPETTLRLEVASSAPADLLVPPLVAPTPLAAAGGAETAAPAPTRTCDFSKLPAVVWWGDRRHLPLKQLAAYLAPVFWFSPDEPLLGGAEGVDIRIPQAFPFEAPADAPVVYYQLDQVVGEEDAYQERPGGRGEATLDLARTQAFSLTYLVYFPSEVGLGAHPHDLEPAEFKAVVAPIASDLVRDRLGIQCDEPGWVIVVSRVTGQAHGLVWFYNVLESDEETRFPMHLLVEEGKHALATDKNGDGYFTPGYDANVRINDAWGVRDTIRSGMLFTGGFQAWMAKVRRPEHRILPPLPKDSPLTLRNPKAGGPLVTYELRPYPDADQAGGDPHLHHLMAWREVDDWPHHVQSGSLEQLADWVDAGRVLKSLSIALMFDGNLGVSFVFPFFVVKNLQDPVGGGFIVWRLYLTNHARDLGWMAMYAPSASRWFDTYFAAGGEWAETVAGAGRNLDFVLETGVKFRVNLVTTPLKFLGVLTDFWGLRVGVRNRGFADIDQLTYVIELGAGVW